MVMKNFADTCFLHAAEKGNFNASFWMKIWKRPKRLFQGHRSNQCQAPEGKFLRKLLCRKSLLLLPLHTPQILDTLHLETQLQLFFLFSLSQYIYTHTISHHMSIKLISFLQFFTCCKIVLRKEKQSQTKTPLWVFLKKTTTQTVIWHRQGRRWQARESIQESQRMKQFLLFWTAHRNPELDSKQTLGVAATGCTAQRQHWQWYQCHTVSGELRHRKQL